MALMGFMGAGKTTVGRLLAPMLGWRFVDTDAVLVERHGASIASLFQDFGEAQFREWESSVVASFLGESEIVIALGGGAVEHPRSQALLFGDPGTLTVYLEVPLEVARMRCRGGAARPVLGAQGVEQRYAARLPLYREARMELSSEAAQPSSLAFTLSQAVQRKVPSAGGEPGSPAAV